MLATQLGQPLLAARRLALQAVRPLRSSCLEVPRSAQVQVLLRGACGLPRTSWSRCNQEVRCGLASAVKQQRPALPLGRLGVRLGAPLLAGAGCAAWVFCTATGPVQCQVQAAAQRPSPEPPTSPAPKGDPGDGRGETPLQSALGVLGGALAIGTMVTLWAVAIVMPVALVAAFLTSRWRIAGLLCALYALPHAVPPPTLPLLRRPLFAGLKRWLGLPGAWRFEDWSLPSTSEPEPEPAPGRAAKPRQLFCIHPHGIYTMGALLLAESRPEIRILTSPFLYHFAPIFRTFGQTLMGLRMGSVARSDLERYMRAGEPHLALVPGGFHEATITNVGSERVFLKTRAGFVKYALRHGYDLVPVYTFGEGDLMHNMQGGWSWRFGLNALSLPAVLPCGHWLVPLFPRRGVSLVTVVGPPVPMPRIEKPTKEDVEKHHARYVQALQELYRKAAPGTGSAGRPLEVW